MTSIFCAISYIKNVSGSNKICSRSAVCRTGSNDFVEYVFKAFRFSETTLVEEVTKGSISLIIDRFTFVIGELNVTIEQNTPLKIQTLEDYLSMYDLLISLPFGIFTAPVQDPSTPEENKSPNVQHNAEVQQHNAEVQQHNAEVQCNAEVQHNAEVRHNAIDLTRLDENSAEHLRTTVKTDNDGLYSDEEQTNNPDDEDTP
ncbi:hypothetical protein C2G38_2150532 [Gigaspora rosea]|uniref:Uncharacterized protein n=1 Tax=Gigaspora rosea TaxID=44941 RepID=A0A397TT13_9GLOM|nr:hypothetical protein C2G38_2150532 [Gigaspora rosea]